jgi:hypothetical protein
MATTEEGTPSTARAHKTSSNSFRLSVLFSLPSRSFWITVFLEDLALFWQSSASDTLYRFTMHSFRFNLKPARTVALITASAVLVTLAGHGVRTTLLDNDHLALFKRDGGSVLSTLRSGYVFATHLHTNY